MFIRAGFDRAFAPIRLPVRATSTAITPYASTVYAAKCRVAGYRSPRRTRQFGAAGSPCAGAWSGQSSAKLRAMSRTNSSGSFWAICQAVSANGLPCRDRSRTPPSTGRANAHARDTACAAASSPRSSPAFCTASMPRTPSLPVLASDRIHQCAVDRDLPKWAKAGN